MNVLNVCASPRPINESVSKQLAASFFAKLLEINGEANVINVDLYQHKPPFLSLEGYRAFWQPVVEPGYELTDVEKRSMTYGMAQGQQLRDSDVLVLSMPLWNCGMPAIMKAYFDQVLIPGLVFNVEGDEIKPSHQIRKVIVLASSGKALKEEDPYDALTPQVSAIMNYIGITDIASAWADGQDTAQAEEHKQMAMEAAEDLAEEVGEMKL